MQTAECPHQENVGVYILGALDLGERAEFEAHLGGCASCQRELAPLAGLPGQLNALDPDGASSILEEVLEASGVPGEDPAGTAALEPGLWAAALLNGHGPGAPAAEWGSQPPPGLLATVHGISARRRRIRSRAGLTAAAAVLVAVGVAAGAEVGHRSQPSQAAGQTGGMTYGQPVGGWRTVRSPASQGPAAVVMYRQMGWGTQLQAKVTGLPAGVRCQMTVLSDDGTAVVAGSWDTDAMEGAVVYPASADVAASGIREIVITDGNRPPITVQA